MNRALYVVGNGFDLHHCLPTSVDHFLNILNSRHAPDGYFCGWGDFLSNYGIEWSLFEQSLAEINLEQMGNDFITYPDYLSDHESDRDNTISQMKSLLSSIEQAIYTALNDMVEAANDLLSDARFCKGVPRIGKAFADAAGIVNFNYTSTIEALYDLPDDLEVLHIHGCCDNGDNLLYGYGKTQTDRNQINLLSSRMETCEDSYEAEQCSQLISFYKGLMKNTQIEKLSNYISELNGVERIVVFGHSMGEVDSEYLEQIENILQPKRWYISQYKGWPSDECMSSYSFRDKVHFFSLGNYGSLKF